MVTQYRSRIVCGGMLRENTPVQHYPEWGLWVKREDLACPPPGPPFSKTRGVYNHVASRTEEIIAALDTYHSQAGHAVARACQVLGKQCMNFYPDFKHEPGPRGPQLRARELGATLHPLKAGMSAVLWHQARKATESLGGYMMPNALKLTESVDETARECNNVPKNFDMVIIPASSGTIASGVIRGLGPSPVYVIHMGYSRAHGELLGYIRDKSGVSEDSITLVDEDYAYKAKAREGPSPPWPCNAYYDLKAFRWWARVKDDYRHAKVLFWNIG